MSKPVRIQLRRSKGWKMPANTVKVDRSTPWGNPFAVGRHGNQAKCVDLYEKLMTGFVAISLDNAHFQHVARMHVEQHRDELRGKNLACWCRIGTPCHADVLLRIANQVFQTAP